MEEFDYDLLNQLNSQEDEPQEEEFDYGLLDQLNGIDMADPVDSEFDMSDDLEPSATWEQSTSGAGMIQDKRITPRMYEDIRLQELEEMRQQQQMEDAIKEGEVLSKGAHRLKNIYSDDLGGLDPSFLEKTRMRGKSIIAESSKEAADSIIREFGGFEYNVGGRNFVAVPYKDNEGKEKHKLFDVSEFNNMTPSDATRFIIQSGINIGTGGLAAYGSKSLKASKALSKVPYIGKFLQNSPKVTALSTYIGETLGGGSSRALIDFATNPSKSKELKYMVDEATVEAANDIIERHNTYKTIAKNELMAGVPVEMTLQRHGHLRPSEEEMEFKDNYLKYNNENGTRKNGVDEKSYEDWLMEEAVGGLIGNAIGGTLKAPLVLLKNSFKSLRKRTHLIDEMIPNIKSLSDDDKSFNTLRNIGFKGDDYTLAEIAAIIKTYNSDIDIENKSLAQLATIPIDPNNPTSDVQMPAEIVEILTKAFSKESRSNISIKSAILNNINNMSENNKDIMYKIIDNYGDKGIDYMESAKTLGSDLMKLHYINADSKLQNARDLYNVVYTSKQNYINAKLDQFSKGDIEFDEIEGIVLGKDLLDPIKEFFGEHVGKDYETGIRLLENGKLENLTKNQEEIGKLYRNIKKTFTEINSIKSKEILPSPHKSRDIVIDELKENLSFSMDTVVDMMLKVNKEMMNKSDTMTPAQFNAYNVLRKNLSNAITSVDIGPNASVSLKQADKLFRETMNEIEAEHANISSFAARGNLYEAKMSRKRFGENKIDVDRDIIFADDIIEDIYGKVMKQDKGQFTKVMDTVKALYNSGDVRVKMNVNGKIVDKRITGEEVERQLKKALWHNFLDKFNKNHPDASQFSGTFKNMYEARGKFNQEFNKLVEYTGGKREWEKFLAGVKRDGAIQNISKSDQVGSADLNRSLTEGLGGIATAVNTAKNIVSKHTKSINDKYGLVLAFLITQPKKAKVLIEKMSDRSGIPDFNKGYKEINKILKKSGVDENEIPLMPPEAVKNFIERVNGKELNIMGELSHLSWYEGFQSMGRDLYKMETDEYNPQLYTGNIQR